MKRVRNLLKRITAKKSVKKDLSNPQDVFLYATLHDLKSPINNIESLLSILRKELKDQATPEISGIMDKINHSTSLIQESIHRLAEVTKEKTSPYEDITVVKFDKILDEIISENENVIRKANISIERDFDVKQMEYSKSALKTIMYNLFTNAVKYRAPDRGTKIQLQTCEKKGHIIFRISDNGLGIDLKKHRNKLFRIFNRINNHIEGTGLGLYMIKKIVELKGGKIEVRSKPNEGTAFQVTF